MKNYTIIITEKKTKSVVKEFTELSNTKKYLKAKYGARYQFSQPPCTVKITRLIRKPGIQTDLWT